MVIGEVIFLFIDEYLIKGKVSVRDVKNEFLKFIENICYVLDFGLICIWD